jgi:hypothetical protein
MSCRGTTTTTPASQTYTRSSPPATQDVRVLRDWLGLELARVQQGIPRANVTTISANYTALPTDGVVLADSTTAPVTVTLPDPARVQYMQVTIKRANAGSNLVTIGGVVDGQTNPLLTEQYASATIISDGTRWIVDGTSLAVLGGIDPALQPDTDPTPQNDEFNGNTLNSKWSWVNQGTSTAALTKGRLVLTPQISGNPANNNVRLLLQAVPSGNWAIRSWVNNYCTVLNCGGGPVAYNSANGKFLFQSNLSRVTGSASSARLLAAYWTNTTTFSTSVNDQNPPNGESRRWFMQMRYDGTLLYIDYSPDNAQYFNVTSVNAVTAIGAAPTSFGFAVNAPSSVATPGTGFDFFRCYHNADLNQA